VNYDQMFRLDGQVALVVGAASGIGAAAAEGLSAAGAFVICADSNSAGASATAARLPNAASIPLDVTDPEAVKAAVDYIAQKHKRIDVLVSTPAINVRKPLLQYTNAEFQKVLRVNLEGNFNVAQAVGRLMQTQGSGSIILLSSIRSLTVEPGQSVYAATKAGIVQLARGLASELGPHGVRVNCIAPGVVETPLTLPIKSKPEWYEAYANKNALRRWAQPSEMAGPVVFLASSASSYMTGAVLFVDGGWTAVDGRFEPPV
jgi:NAD(P)-dependent dehydrogenase (short-subunit alcohol dehydrogenase family)